MSTDATAGPTASLLATGLPFGGVRESEPAPRWGGLFARLDRDADPAYVTAIELIYEGYLLHYRESRVVDVPADDLETRLLAGDCFYARGLRGIAALGDADGVGLLARLMATCSFLRSAGAPFAGDDALWAYTMGGLAAQRGGTSPQAASTPFDEIDAALGVGAHPDVRAIVTRAAGELPLAEPAPLLAELGDPSSVTGTGSLSPATPTRR